MPTISRKQLKQISRARDLSKEGQGLGCAVCFARQPDSNKKPPEHFKWCWVGIKLKECNSGRKSHRKT